MDTISLEFNILAYGDSNKTIYNLINHAQPLVHSTLASPLRCLPCRGSGAYARSVIEIATKNTKLTMEKEREAVPMGRDQNMPMPPSGDS